MPSFRINFTKAELDKAKLPEQGKRNYYYDLKESGLMMQVTAKGAKSFYLYRKIEGKPERVLLGKYPDISIERARKKAAIEKGEIAEGNNPQEKKRAIKAEITFKEMFEQYMERYSKIHKKSWKYDEREIKKYLKHWFSRRISTIKNHEVRKLHETIHNENGLYQANRILERVRSLYNKAIEWGWQGENPALGIKKFREKSRDRFIQPDEMKKFMEAVENEQNQTARDLFKMLLFTGARKTNTLMMRWEEISFEYRAWRIPETKNGDPVIIPLIPAAIEILERRKRENTKNSPWVFQGDGEAGYYNDPKKAWSRVRKASGLTDLRMHDLRRTMGSYQAITGASLPVIGRSLGHKSQQATQVYAHLYMDPVRESVEKASAAMFEMGSREDG
ncbi:MAG: recombinase XerD [Bdellovibrionales bacterium CG22_combo_CG10-13_8_21_14_all_38_13]|nr:MAG: recombinase XerD [Bdellovibrionales bacterium CG22_combo_CG10-13_8_21_14_all_38_13]PIR33347.1 MAG: recombinase XerD [Alphaproteobacteria bacterium CG11_big_fil_rev_8_21_14_0_20_44_7]